MPSSAAGAILPSTLHPSPSTLPSGSAKALLVRAPSRRAFGFEDLADLMSRIIEVTLRRHVVCSLRCHSDLGVELFELTTQHRLDLAGVCRGCGRAAASTTTTAATAGRGCVRRRIDLVADVGEIGTLHAATIDVDLRRTATVDLRPHA